MDSAGRNHGESPPSHHELYRVPQEESIYQSAKLEHVPRIVEDLRDYNWEQLQEKYATAMEDHGRSEENLRAQTAKLLEVS